MSDDLRWMLEYALEAPDFNACKMLLVDALHGVTGASDCERIRATAAWRRDAKKYGVVIRKAKR